MVPSLPFRLFSGKFKQFNIVVVIRYLQIYFHHIQLDRDFSKQKVLILSFWHEKSKSHLIFEVHLAAFLKDKTLTNSDPMQSFE